MPRRTLRYIIVGYGNIGHKRQAVLKNKCLATVDPNPAVKADFTDSTQVPQAIVDQVDAVVLAVSKKPKIELLLYWLGKGKHVLVEKPLLLSTTQSQQLLATAKKHHVIWYTAYNFRFEPHIIRIKKLLEKGTFGQFYHGRITYGFGNVQQLLSTWRNSGYGVLDEVGCHLVDFARYFFPYQANDYKAIHLRTIEASVPDYCLFCTTDNKLLLEASWVHWKNVFTVDFFFERGSVHMNGLCKWGESELLMRKRVLPAGVPKQSQWLEQGPDQTWQRDTAFFEKMVAQQKNCYQDDVYMSTAMHSIVSDGNTSFDDSIYRFQDTLRAK